MVGRNDRENENIKGDIMKYIIQFGIILTVTLIGEVLAYFVPLPVPAGIYGLLLMLAGLITKVIPLHAVKETAKFLLDIMPLLFVPSTVGLIDKWGILRPVLIPVTVTVLLSTVIVMVVSGHATQLVIRIGKRKEASQGEGVTL